MTLPPIIEALTDRLAPALRMPVSGPGVCPRCFAFYDSAYPQCYGCSQAPSDLIDVMAPITYALSGERAYFELWRYKNDALAEQRRGYWNDLAALLWRFVAAHEGCLASRVGRFEFDVACVVPSKDPSKAVDRPDSLRMMAGHTVVEPPEVPALARTPLADRYEDVLRAKNPPSVDPGSRMYHPERFEASRSLRGQDVLLVDDTWVTGAAAYSAAAALRAAGARSVGCLVLGRKISPGWDTPLGTAGRRYSDLPQEFDWNTCAVHARYPVRRTPN